jgi:hypothetical protein
MRTYQYQILRYLHDRSTGEFINIGIVVYSSQEQYLNAKVISKYARITSFFAGANGKLVLRSAKQFKTEVGKTKRLLTGLLPSPESLSEITNKILPKDDSSLILSEVKKGIDVDFDRSISELYRLLVERWQIEQEDSAVSDTDVWKNKYKKYFDEFGVTNRLTNYDVETNYDTFTFDKAWRNEIWHCYQPLSFNLKTVESIKSKVYKWSGRIREIATADEKIDLTFLTSIPNKYLDLNSFIDDTLREDTENISVNIIYENQAEQFAQRLVQDMIDHDEIE